MTLPNKVFMKKFYDDISCTLLFIKKGKKFLKGKLKKVARSQRTVFFLIVPKRNAQKYFILVLFFIIDFQKCVIPNTKKSLKIL